jgi:hypothetical protein
LLKPEEQERLEKELMLNDEFLEQLSASEDELIDLYLLGGLSEAERQRFSDHFLPGPGRRQKLALAEALHRYVRTKRLAQTQREDDRSSLWRNIVSGAVLTGRPAVVRLIAAVIVIVVTGVSWLIVNRVWLNNRPLNGSVLAISLNPGPERSGGETQRIAIGPSVSNVRLELELTRDEYDSYRAFVQTDEGREVWSGSTLKSESLSNRSVVVVALRAKLLARGDYLVRLSGVTPSGGFEEVETYPFRVTEAAY